MNPSAVINIILMKNRDVISGFPIRSIWMDINTAGDFNMYGTYSIEKGEYLFTLPKPGSIRSSLQTPGRITWAGNLTMRQLICLQSTSCIPSLYKIIFNSTLQAENSGWYCLLLTNKLMNPTINYEINVRGVDATEQTYIREYFELNRKSANNVWSPRCSTSLFQLPVQEEEQRLMGSGAGAMRVNCWVIRWVNWLSQVSKDVT